MSDEELTRIIESFDWAGRAIGTDDDGIDFMRRYGLIDKDGLAVGRWKSKFDRAYSHSPGVHYG